MPPSTVQKPKASREPRFNPMWWFVIGAFLLLITAWSTIIILSQLHKVEVIEGPEATEVEGATDDATEGPEE